MISEVMTASSKDGEAVAGVRTGAAVKTAGQRKLLKVARIQF